MKRARNRRQKLGLRGRILIAAFVLTAIAFYPVAILLLVGMLPTIIVRLFDKSPERTKVLTVGFMNFAGCFPYCYQIFAKPTGSSFQSAIAIISTPTDIVIMYGAAVIGHVIEWGIVSFVAGMVVSKGRGRLSDIKAAQDALAKKWGPEVAGELPPEPKAETDID